MATAESTECSVAESDQAPDLRLLSLVKEEEPVEEKIKKKKNKKKKDKKEKKKRSPKDNKCRRRASRSPSTDRSASRRRRVSRPPSRDSESSFHKRSPKSRRRSPSANGNASRRRRASRPSRSPSRGDSTYSSPRDPSSRSESPYTWDVPLYDGAPSVPPPIYKRHWSPTRIQRSEEKREIPENPRFIIPVRTLLRKMSSIIKAAHIDEVNKDRLRQLIKLQLIQRIKDLLKNIEVYLRYGAILNIYRQNFPEYTDQALVEELVTEIKDLPAIPNIKEEPKDPAVPVELGAGGKLDLWLEKCSNLPAIPNIKEEPKDPAVPVELGAGGKLDLWLEKFSNLPAIPNIKEEPKDPAVPVELGAGGKLDLWLEKCSNLPLLKPEKTPLKEETETIDNIATYVSLVTEVHAVD